MLERISKTIFQCNDNNGEWICGVQRRNNNMTYRINDFDVDNRWVVPYNCDIIVRYDSHINIERCAHSKVIKYLYKYIHKGPDCATIVIKDNSVQPNNNG